MKTREATKEEQLEGEIPKCGGKAKPKDPPPGAGTGEWDCVDDEWTWIVEGGGV